MSRFFSSAAKAAKDIKWELKGTTKNLEKQLAKIQTAVDGLPELAEVVEKGRVK
jgi:hypothetical protein